MHSILSTRIILQLRNAVQDPGQRIELRVSRLKFVTPATTQMTDITQTTPAGGSWHQSVAVPTRNEIV